MQIKFSTEDRDSKRAVTVDFETDLDKLVSREHQQVLAARAWIIAVQAPIRTKLAAGVVTPAQGVKLCQEYKFSPGKRGMSPEEKMIALAVKHNINVEALVNKVRAAKKNNVSK